MVGALVRQRLERLGEEGARWLADLPSVVEELERRWSLVTSESLAEGSAAYVARVRTADGRDAVLRIGVPGLDHARQARTIAAADGRGYVRLLAQDPERRAMLLEALGASLHSLGLPPERVIATLCHTLREAWTVPLPPDATVAPSEEKARALAELVGGLWEELGRPCSEAVADQALRFAERRVAAFDLERCVVVHGDPHPANALRVAAPRPGAESGFVFIDPDGFLADPTYDLGVVLRGWCPELLAGDATDLAARYCRQLAAETGLDAAAIWEWGFLERVSSGLFILSLGAEEMARPFLQTAELLV